MTELVTPPSKSNPPPSAVLLVRLWWLSLFWTMAPLTSQTQMPTGPPTCVLAAPLA